MAEKAKKKSGFGNVFAILIILMMIGAGAGILFLLYNNMPGGSTPEEVFEQYMKAINGKKYDIMYDLVSDTVKEEGLEEQAFITRNKRIYEGIESAHLQATITGIQNNNDTVVISYDTTMQTICGEIRFSNTMTMSLNADKKYKINWTDSLIFPQLTANDKVRYSTLTPLRGSIYDRNKEAIATHGEGAEIGIVPSDLEEDRDNYINQIAYLLNIPAETIEAKLNENWVEETSVVPITTISSNNEEILQLLLMIPGVQIDETTIRTYPYGKIMAHITGYVQSINAEELEARADQGYNIHSVIGKNGLELAYEERLRGVAGGQIYIVDSNEETKAVLATIEAQDGEDIVLTIDADMQTFMYKQLEGNSGFSIAMDAEVGEIYALVSTPSYDPNDFVLGLSTEQWNTLNEDESKPLFNRFTSTWTPGSTFKSVTGAIGTTLGVINIEETKASNGTKWQKDKSWGDHYVTTLTTYGNQVNLKNALVYSDNIYFAQAALNIGMDSMMEQLKAIGYGESLPFDLTLTSSTFGTNQTIENEFQLADTGYGQGENLINPIHFASIYSALVNKGNMVTPYIEYNSEKQQKIWKSQVFSADAANTILEDLIQVVEQSGGTGSAARIYGTTIAGKTGTAEIKDTVDDTQGTELGWFAGINLGDGNSHLMNITMVEDVKNIGGSSYVAAKVRAFFEKYQ